MEDLIYINLKIRKKMFSIFINLIICLKNVEYLDNWLEGLLKY